MNKTWKSLVAGILDIVAGVFGLISGLGLILGGAVMRAGMAGMGEIPGFMPGLLAGMAIPLVIIAILAIVGGVYALKRKIWGLALAGSIAAFFPSWPLGIAAIVFTILSKNEFE